MSFVTFEGIDSSGKTTQIELLRKYFSKRKDIVFTSNPGETHLGKELRKILLHKADLKLSEINEMFLFFTGIQDNYEKVFFLLYHRIKMFAVTGIMILQLHIRVSEGV